MFLFNNDTFTKNKPEINLYRFKKQHSHLVHENVARSFYESFTNNSGRDDILKALTGVTKAYYHFKELDHVHNESSPDTYISAYDLIVILDGHLLEAYMDSNNEMVVEPREYIQMFFQYLSPSYTELIDGYYQKLMIHVVHVDYLDEFLHNKNEYHQKMFNHIKAKWETTLGKNEEPPAR